MKRSLVLGGFALFAAALMSLAWWGIGAAERGEVLAAASSTDATTKSDSDPRVELEDPNQVAASATLPSQADAADSERAPVEPRLVDAAFRKSGIDLNGTIVVLGGETRNLPPLTLTFRRGESSLQSLVVEGQYLLPGIAPGRWQVSAETVGYRPLSVEIELAAEPRHQQLDLTMERLPYLFVTLLAPNGEPLKKALRSERGPVAGMEVFAVATLEPPRERLGATLEDSYRNYGIGQWRAFAAWNGEVEIDEPRAGVLELPRALPVYVSACVENVVLRTRYVPASAENVEFVISPEELRAARGSLRLRIVDGDTGTAITQGRVGLHANGQFGTGREIIQPDGTVEIADLTPGPRNLAIVCRGYEWIVEQVDIEAGIETDLGVFRLSRPVSIEGTAVDANGAPVRAWVSVWPLDQYDAAVRIADKFCWRADADGRFRVQPAGRRRYLLRANDEEWAGEPVIVDTTSGPVQNVRLRVARGVPLSVTFEPGTPRGARLHVRDGHGQSLAERAVDPGRPAKIGLAPGRYSVQVDFDGALHGDRAIEVAGQPVSISLGP
jgi:hypothetical protein